MFKRYIFSTVVCLVSSMACAQYHEVFTNSIRSLQVVCGDKWLAMPIMKLNDNSSTNTMNIAFDDLSHTYRRFTYNIEHCEADWSTTESLFASDYIDGFSTDNTIDDIEESINTNTLYTHYRLSIPNENLKIKLSGNYRLNIIDDNSGEKILSACFMVVEPITNVTMKVSTNTDIDTNKSHQQIDMTLSYNGLRITDPSTQIKTVILQNGRWDNARINVKPQYITTNSLQWTHNRKLIFDAGNEYHKFEILATSHATLGVDNIGWDGKNYHAYLFPNEPRPNYLYDEDANGAFYIRNSDNIENDRTSDYMYVHFALNCSSPVSGDVYINGAWTYDRFLPEYKMQYNETKKCYEASIPLKLGYYSFQYVMLNDNGEATIMPTEGSFFQTENKYQALVYYRGQTDRTDRLVGYNEIQIK